MTQIIVVAPPVAVAALTGQSVLDADELRVRNIDLPLANLPHALDGLTIAHVSDPHLGSFMSDRKYKRIIELTNEIDADVIFQTGDLINFSLKDLPDGVQLLRQFRSRSGTYCCQGNHDVIENRNKFNASMRHGDINLLLDESRVIELRGQRVELIAPRWYGPSEPLLRWSVMKSRPAPATDAFPILLAHHPHCFDTANEMGIPLMFGGHSHGGQVALTENIGIGRIMYRYWSGLYRKGNNACVISNGVGNWFPLRINVPAEILKIVLRRI